MDGTRRGSEPSKPVTNGRGPTRGLLDGRAAELTGALRAGESPDREATRYLSAATQIDIKYAENVVGRVVNERLRALAPTFGVDVPVVIFNQSVYNVDDIKSSTGVVIGDNSSATVGGSPKGAG